MSVNNDPINSFCKYLPKIENKCVTPIIKSQKSFINVENVVPQIPEQKKEKTIEIVPKFIPQKIDDTYDVFMIDKIIKNFLENKIQDLSKINSQLEKLFWIKNNTTDEIEKIDAKKQIFKLNKEIFLIQDRKEIIQYEKNTRDLLEQLKLVKVSQKSFVFVETFKSKEEYDQEEIKKKFLKIAKIYIHIDFKHRNKKLACKICQHTNFESIDDNFYACQNCNSCVQLLDDSHSYKDIDRLNLSARYTYTKRGHFKEAIEKFQGLQNTNIDKKVYDTILQEQEKHGIKNLTTDHIFLFLQENKFTKHYEDIRLIHSTLTKKDPPNISSYENDLLRLFDQQEEVYGQIKDPDRINSLNVNYKLMKLLQKLGYKCKIEDMPMLKTRDKISDHDDTWRDICKKLNWDFIPTI